MNRQQFLDYIAENYSISGEAFRLIDNILLFVETHYDTEGIQYVVLSELLSGTIGLTDAEIKKICL